MAEKKFESEDPMELVGTLMEADDEAIQDMGLTFIEELARMKWPRADIEAVFSDPFYRGPHTVFRAKGPAFVSQLIDSVLGEQLVPQAQADQAPAGAPTRPHSSQTGLFTILKREDRYDA